ncbi:MAG: carbonic anhydrase [Acidimicrobiia bacterium]|nr:carbonic anhydrase [Acidimicrobiia bacterium]
MPASEGFLARNEEFVASHEPASLPPMPRLGAVIVSCIDWRVDPAHFAGLELGEAFVLRVLGGRVTETVAAQIVAADGLSRLHGDPLEEIVVIHHTGCGTAAFADRDLAERVADGVGLSADDLQAIAVDDPRRTVAHDVALLAGRTDLDAAVSGLIYDLDDGRLTRVV